MARTAHSGTFWALAGRLADDRQLSRLVDLRGRLIPLSGSNLQVSRMSKVCAQLRWQAARRFFESHRCSVVALLARYVLLAAEDVANDLLAAEDVANDDDTACCLVNAPCCGPDPGLYSLGCTAGGCEFWGGCYGRGRRLPIRRAGAAGIHRCVDRLPDAGWLTPARQCAVTGRWCRSAERAARRADLHRARGDSDAI